MKEYVLIFSLLAACSSCSVKNNKNEIDNVTVFLMGYTDLVTEYNKGVAVASFLQYDFKTDSVVYRKPIDGDSGGFEMFAGKFTDKKYIDTIIRAIKFLKQYPEGVVASRLDSMNATYCGPVFYLQYQAKNSSHLYSFIIDDDNPLSDLNDFFARLDELSWDKKPKESNTVYFDSMAVNATIKLGYYDEIEMPYVPLKCEPRIEMEKIYGEWRSVGNEYNRETRNTYNKRVFTEDGIYEDERIKKDISTFKFTAKFSLDQKRNTVILNKNGRKKELRILKLTDDCLEFKFEGINSIFIYNRLR
jgi:hypothetical protein